MKTLLLTLSLLRNILFNSPVHSQEISLEPYCKNGYYEIPGEEKCSRAPNCGGYGYDELNTASKMPDANNCMGQGAVGRGKGGCAGYVPLCCYEVARTGDFTKCIGYWERLWCTKSQCDVARTKGASDSQCGGDCQCSHAHLSYCGNKDPIPLSDRLNGATPQPTTVNPTPTSQNQPTNTPVPNQTYDCPTTSSRSYDSISVKNANDNRAAAEHPDKNFQMRGAVGTSGTKNLIHNNGPKDSSAPQLSTVLSNTKPAIVGLYQVYDWSWGSNGALGSKGSPLTSPWDVTMIGLSANSGDSVHVPAVGSAYSIGSGYNATVLYASSDTITLKYTIEDSIAGGYAIQYDGICVDPSLVSLYNQLNGSGRSKLPALKNKQTIGTAKTNEVKVAVRDTGTYMDPRSDDSWWIGIGSLPNSTSTPQPTNGSTPKPTPTSGAGTTTAPTTATEPTRPAGSCTAADTPNITAPIAGGGIYAGTNTITWVKVSAAQKYALRIDDMTNGWKGTCSGTQNAGDVCTEVDKNITKYQFTAEEGHSYNIWIHAVNYCGEWGIPRNVITHTAPPIGANTCRIQGYRALKGGLDQSLINDQTKRFGTTVNTTDPTLSESVWVPDTIKALQVTVTGGTINKSYEYNPFWFIVEGDKQYTASIESLAGYNIYSTLCPNEINSRCKTVDQVRQNGPSITFMCKAGQIVDLWWYFRPDTIPTIAYSPTAAPTTTLAPPTPTSCPAIPELAWREGETHYTRTVVSYDGTGGNIVETISLHLKQITQSGVTVEASTDNGATWAASESSENDDHFVTIENRNTEVIPLQVRLTDACTQTSTVLTEDVATVPLPSGSITPSGSLTPAASISKEVIIGASLLVALVIAAFFIGA